MTTAQLEIERVLNSPTLIMGYTKSGKSSLLATGAAYVWETYHKITRLYTCDLGGFPMQVETLMKLGIIQVFRMRTRSGRGLIHETMQRSAQGWWPKRIDPRTGEVDPNVPMIAPLTEAITMLCPEGHPVKTVPFRSMLTPAKCPTCSVQVTPQNMKTHVSTSQTKGFETVGWVAFDGLTSMLAWGIDDLTERTGRQELTGEKSALGGVVNSGEMVFAGSNRAQVGFMQNRANSLVAASASIPNLVIPPAWTCLIAEGTDDGLRIAGPMIIGQARTADAPAWFGDTIETVVISTNDGKEYRRLNLQQYVDPNGVKHLCGIRTFPTYMPAHLEDEVTGEGYAPFVNFNLGMYYRLRNDAKKKHDEAEAAKYPDAPGLPEGIVEIGEVVAAPPATAAPTTPVAGPKPPVGPRPAVGPRPGPRPMHPAPAPPPVPPTSPTVPASAGSVSAAPTEGSAAPTPAPSTAAPFATPSVNTPVTSATPAPPKPPVRGPSAPPPGRRPVPAPARAQPPAPPTPGTT